jgi:hypothetical protein
MVAVCFIFSLLFLFYELFPIIEARVWGNTEIADNLFPFMSVLLLIMIGGQGINLCKDLGDNNSQDRKILSIVILIDLLLVAGSLLLLFFGHSGMANKIMQFDLLAVLPTYLSTILLLVIIKITGSKIVKVICIIALLAFYGLLAYYFYLIIL